jgi:hypothetical protein
MSPIVVTPLNNLFIISQLAEDHCGIPQINGASGSRIFVDSDMTEMLLRTE